MNCKPGDLARIYGMPPACANANDRIVKLKDQAPDFLEGEPHWQLEHPVDFQMARGGRNKFTGELYEAGDRVYIDSCNDKYLRPIRGLPGTDEILLKAGKPKANDLAPRPVEVAR